VTILLSLFILLGGEQAVHFDRGPYLQFLDPSRVLIISQSEAASRARLRYGADVSLPFLLEEDQPRHDHRFLLEDLVPGTDYSYQLSYDDSALPVTRFRTLPGPQEAVTAGVIGDSAGLTPGRDEIARLLENRSPDLFLHTGDIVDIFALAGAYQSFFFDVYADLLTHVPVFPVKGNHDCLWPSYPRIWEEMFPVAEDPRLYTFAAGPARFFAITEYDRDRLSPETLTALENELAACRAAWKIVYLHHTVYSHGPHGGEGAYRGAFASLMDKYAVDFVLSGHDHFYERSYPLRDGWIAQGYANPEYVRPGGTIYVVTGGGGKPLNRYLGGTDSYVTACFREEHHAVFLEISQGEIRLQAVGGSGAIFDEIRLRREGERPTLSFRRGDVNEDGNVGVGDAVSILAYLFGGFRGVCLAACDVDSSGAVTISDAVFLLAYLFAGGAGPQAPFPEPGVVPDADERGCRGLNAVR